MMMSVTTSHNVRGTILTTYTLGV